MVQFLQRGESDSTKPVAWGGWQWRIWLLKTAPFLLHTSHILSDIYNSANFPDRSEQLAKLHQFDVQVLRWQMEMARNDYPDTEDVHACANVCLEPVNLHVLRVTAYCVTWMEKVYCGTVAQIKDKKIGCRHQFYGQRHLARATWTCVYWRFKEIMKWRCYSINSLPTHDTTDCNWDVTSTSFTKRRL